jgi:proteasome lid subunit RPN8/RPN11
MEMNEDDMKIKEEIWKIVREKKEFDNEICGIAKKIGDKVICVQCKNISESPGSTYELDPKELAMTTKDTDLFGGGEGQFLGIWHTHPFGPDGPSGIDTSEMIYEKNYYVLCLRSDSFTKFRKEKMTVIREVGNYEEKKTIEEEPTVWKLEDLKDFNDFSDESVWEELKAMSKSDLRMSSSEELNMIR